MIKQSKNSNKALFLDRDGVVNYDYGHVYKVDEFTFILKIIDVIRYFKNIGFKIIIVTNQAGIAKGIYSKADFLSLNDWMLEELKKNGAEIDQVYYCPHKNSDGCFCRKPHPGMFLKAIDKFSIDPDKSFMIGDKETDLIAARKAGIKNRFLLEKPENLNEIFNSMKNYI